MAMAVSFGISSYIEGGVIAAVIVLNIIVGFNQEFIAEKNMDSLRSLSSPTASAVRDGNIKVIPTAEIVPGDMVELKTGDTVPADVRYAMGILLPRRPSLTDQDYWRRSILKPTRHFSRENRSPSRKMPKSHLTRILGPGTASTLPSVRQQSPKVALVAL